MYRTITKYTFGSSTDPKLHPAILAGTPKLENVTDKYRFISSGQQVEDVESLGWKLGSVQGSSEFGKHLMTFTNSNYTLDSGDKITLLARNAHDGSARFEYILGLFRLVCSNGFMVGTAFESHGVRHIGYSANKVQIAVNSVLNQAPKLASSIRLFQSVEVTPEQTSRFLAQASTLRKCSNPIELNYSRRLADKSNTLWTLLNRVQENLIQGGFSTGRTASRTLKAVDRQVTVNRALWDIAEKIAA